jgi:hypothetical protein
MLGLLRMTMNQAIDAVVAITSAVFPDGSREAADRIENSQNFKAVLESILQARHISVDIKMFERSRPPSTCKVSVHFHDLGIPN